MTLDSFRLDGRAALVTGASRGLGAAIAQALAEAGAAVVCHGNSTDPETTRKRVTERGGKAACVSGDLSNPSAPATLFTKRFLDLAESIFS